MTIYMAQTRAPIVSKQGNLLFVLFKTVVIHGFSISLSYNKIAHLDPFEESGLIWQNPGGIHSNL